MKQLLFTFIFLFSISSFSAKKGTSVELATFIHNSWTEAYLHLTKNTAGYSAPVAARTFHYINFGIYEAIHPFFKGQKSLSNQINAYTRTTSTDAEGLSLPIVLNEITYKLILFYYKGMPPYERKVLNAHYKTLKSKYPRGRKRKKRSIAYAASIFQEITGLSKTDGGHESYMKNFPKEYKIAICDSCWAITPPGFTPALLPYWGQNRLMIPSNIEICKSMPTLKFSADSLSEFYKENMMVNKAYTNATKESEIIGEFWDDAPGYSGTPIGHLFNIAYVQSKKRNQSLIERSEMFALMGIALNDAVIEAWRYKYSINLIRPITYIREYINPTFNTIIQTPPFPEFPSGHSFQSGSGTEVLKHYLGDNFTIIDETNVERTDIDGSARTFENFTAMSEEMSLSRFYGGIHYFKTLEISLDYGRKIGQNCISQIQFK